MKPRCTEVYCIHVGHMGERITCIRGPPALPASVAHPALPASVARLQCLHPWPACITCICRPPALPASVARLHYLRPWPACIACIRGPLTMLLVMLPSVRLRQWSGCLPPPAYSSIHRSPLCSPPTSSKLSGPMEQEPGQS